MNLFVYIIVSCDVGIWCSIYFCICVVLSDDHAAKMPSEIHWYRHEAFEPPVYEKSADQEVRINDVLSKSFLFNALSKDDLKVSSGQKPWLTTIYTGIIRYKCQRVTRQLFGFPSLFSHQILVVSQLHDYCLNVLNNMSLKE